MSDNLKDQRRILQMLFDDPQDETENCRDLIYNYAEAQIEGKDVAALFPETHEYLEDFGDEDEYYQTILSDLEAKKSGQLEALPPGYKYNDQKAFPPAFPSKSDVQARDNRFVFTEQANGNILIRLAQEFLDTLSNLSIEPQPVFVRSEASELFKLESVVDDNGKTKVTIGANRIDDNDDSCSLTVELAKEGVAWPNLKGTAVKLTDTEAQQEIEEKITDPFGIVTFDQVAVDKLGSIAITIEN